MAEQVYGLPQMRELWVRDSHIVSSSPRLIDSEALRLASIFIKSGSEGGMGVTFLVQLSSSREVLDAGPRRKSKRH